MGLIYSKLLLQQAKLLLEKQVAFVGMCEEFVWIVDELKIRLLNVYEGEVRKIPEVERGKALGIVRASVEMMGIEIVKSIGKLRKKPSVAEWKRMMTAFMA